MQTTTNYGLNKPEQTDFYNVDDFNANMDILDQKVKEAFDNTSAVDTHIADKSNPHDVTKTQVGLGNVPNVSTNNQTPTYTAATTLAELASAEKMSVAFGKIAKAIKDLISHLADTTKHITADERTSWDGKASTSVATGEVNGLMSAADKSKLDGIAAGANKTTVTNNLTSTSTSNALSAAQGKALNDKVTEIHWKPLYNNSTSVLSADQKSGTFTYTAPSQGILYLNLENSSRTTMQVNVNSRGMGVFALTGMTSGNPAYSIIPILLAKGDVVTVGCSSTGYVLKQTVFVPFA